MCIPYTIRTINKICTNDEISCHWIKHASIHRKNAPYCTIARQIFISLPDKINVGSVKYLDENTLNSLQNKMKKENIWKILDEQSYFGIIWILNLSQLWTYVYYYSIWCNQYVFAFKWNSTPLKYFKKNMQKLYVCMLFSFVANCFEFYITKFNSKTQQFNGFWKVSILAFSCLVNIIIYATFCWPKIKIKLSPTSNIQKYVKLIK